MEFSIKDKGFAAFLLVCMLTISLFSFFLFGMAGLRVALGILFISFPFYLILNKFGLSDGEKFILSFIFGITIFPSLVYLLGLLASFRISIFIVFAFLILAAVSINMFKKK